MSQAYIPGETSLQWVCTVHGVAKLRGRGGGGARGWGSKKGGRGCHVRLLHKLLLWDIFSSVTPRVVCTA